MSTIIFILALLSIYFGIWIFMGIKWTLMIFSLFMIILASGFMTKRDFYVKYLELVNPRYAALYNDKDEDFRRKHRITDITVFYIISAGVLFISAYIPNTTLPIQGGNLIYIIITAVLFTILLWRLSLVILKNSNKNSSFWFYFIGLILSAIPILSIIQFLIL